MTVKPPVYFIAGIGGSGMLPLAVILKGYGYGVVGSDRSYDQGRTPEKFKWLIDQGIGLYPQDGSGVSEDLAAVVTSKAVEDTVPDVAAAKKLGVSLKTRSEMLVECFNGAGLRVAVSGTSGKTTTTGMIGFLLKEAGLDPSVMNGGVFRNYADSNLYATAFVGGGDIFVTEVDESDGAAAVAAYRPDIAVLHNITLDHQPMDELKVMFTGFLASANTAILNADDVNVMTVAKMFGGRILTYGITSGSSADLAATEIRERPEGSDTDVVFQGKTATLTLSVPGRHNVSNALAAICAAVAAGVAFEEALRLIPRFSGIRRRMEIVGSARGITVMDDFAHNPDKVAATLSALHAFPGRILIFFQPHGYGFLKVVGSELAEAFAAGMNADDMLFMTEPFYAGGTVDRSVGSAFLVDKIKVHGKHAAIVENRDAARTVILDAARAGDRIVIMGARDDTLSVFAKDLLGGIHE